MKKIEKLIAKQERDLIAYREEWLAIGRSTAPADRPTAEAAITSMYSLLEKPKPYFWWCDGPAVGSMVRTVLSRANLGDNLRALSMAEWAEITRLPYTTIQCRIDRKWPVERLFIPKITKYERKRKAL